MIQAWIYSSDDMGIATTDEGMGQGLSMSANGTRIAMVTSAGVVVYAQDTAVTWMPMELDGGGPIIPYTTYSGANRVDLSADGTRLIMSSRGNGGSGFCNECSGETSYDRCVSSASVYESRFNVHRTLGINSGRYHAASQSFQVCDGCLNI